jgi:hypothetical protein
MHPPTQVHPAPKPVWYTYEIACGEACARKPCPPYSKPDYFRRPHTPVQHFLVSCVLVHCLGMGAWLSNIVWVSCRRCPITFVCVCLFFRLSCHFYVVQPKLLHTIFFLHHVEYCCYRLRGSCYGEGYCCIFPSAVGAVGIIYLQVYC